jgi:uncharacterized protein YbjQ (UPF0145 family)
MIITTTPSVEGKQVTDYLGIVFGEVISGVDFVKDFAAGLSNFFGGRSGTYEDELIRAREQAMQENVSACLPDGRRCNFGVDVDYEVLGSKTTVAYGYSFRNRSEAEITKIRAKFSSRLYW